MRSIALVAAALLLGTGSAARAQNAAHPFYLQGEMVLTAQPEGELLKGRSSIYPPLGGTGLGVRASGGYFITPTLAIEVGMLFRPRVAHSFEGRGRRQRSVACARRRRL